MNLERYYTQNIDEFMRDYFYENAELQSEFDNEKLESKKHEIYDKWLGLLLKGYSEWESAEIAAKEILK